MDIYSLSGFDWDDGNLSKSWNKHGIAKSECEEPFFNLPILLVDDTAHSQVEPRYFILGQTNNSRRLFISFTVRDDKIRIISARDMSRKERAIYAKAAT